MSGLKITTQQIPDTSIALVKPTGFLDAHTFEQLEKEFKKLFQVRKIFKIIVDLSGIKYISSAGAGVFIGHVGTARDFDGDIILLKLSPSVREVFDLLGLSSIFTIFDSKEEAIEKLIEKS